MKQLKAKRYLVGLEDLDDEQHLEYDEYEANEFNYAVARYDDFILENEEGHTRRKYLKALLYNGKEVVLDMKVLTKEDKIRITVQEFKKLYASATDDLSDFVDILIDKAPALLDKVETDERVREFICERINEGEHISNLLRKIEEDDDTQMWGIDLDDDNINDCHIVIPLNTADDLYNYLLMMYFN